MPEGIRTAEPTGACRRAGTIAVCAAALCGGLFLVLAPALLALIPAKELAPPFPEQNQSAETLIYVLVFAVLLPASVWGAFRFERRVSTGSGLEVGAAVLLAALALGVIAIRLLVSAGAARPLVTLLAGLAWIGVAGGVFLRPGSLRVGPRLAWLGALALTLGAAATVVDWGSISRAALLVALLAALVVAQGPGTARLGLRPLPRGLGIALDLAALVLVALAVPDTMIVHPEAALTDARAAFDTEVTQFHQNLFLGAATQVLDGQGILVGTVSQYGVASIYLIAGFFELAPIGYGTLGILDGSLTGLCFAAGYLTLRLAGLGRALSFLTLLVAVIALAWGSTYPEGALLQHGAIRFGMPMALIPLAVAAFRWPRREAAFKVAGLAVVGLSSIWALESFLYVIGTWAGVALVSLAWVEPGGRLRRLVRETLLALAAIAVFHVAFALLTLAAFGLLPDWGAYATYLREFLGGDIGDLTYDVVPFSPGLAVGFAYLASAAGTITLAIRGGQGVRRPTLVALAGLTAYGIVLFSYFDNRSIGHVLSYVCLPAVLLAGLWLALALERPSGFGAFARRAIGAVAVVGAAVLVAAAWPTARDRAPDSALAVALPGGPTPQERWHRLENLPPLFPGAAEGRRLLERHFPGDEPVPVVTVPDLDLNVLVGSGRSNALGITDSKEASWVPGPHLDVVAGRAAELEPGRLMLVDSAALDAWGRLRRDPGATDVEVASATGLSYIGVVALREIAGRFRLVPVERGEGGLAVVRLEPLR